MAVQTGANEGDSLDLSIGDMKAETILGGLDVGIKTQSAAATAITSVDDAINEVSTERAKLGATQNRLEHKINNLDTSAENLQAAESRIRDLDMAKEMTTFTQNNILVQAATAMLAQANAAPQNVLSLLQ
jgi:flagellin